MRNEEFKDFVFHEFVYLSFRKAFFVWCFTEVHLDFQRLEVLCLVISNQDFVLNLVDTVRISFDFTLEVVDLVVWEIPNVWAYPEVTNFPFACRFMINLQLLDSL